MLLINHPLDCPVCDQAGECDLQNFSYEHGTSGTRYEEERRTFDKIDIGPLIQLHMTVAFCATAACIPPTRLPISGCTAY